MAKDLTVDRSFDAYQDFVLGCKLNWTREVFPALKARYGAAVAERQVAPSGPADVEAVLATDTLAQYFAWFERHLQRMKYSGRHGLARHYAAEREQLATELQAGEQSALLALGTDFLQPDYYTAIDIHQHPGGVWSDDVAGYVYERGARTTTPLLKEDADLHHRFTREVLARSVGARRIVDLGCGFGKSTRPFYKNHRELDVTGVELAAPCLKLAARHGGGGPGAECAVPAGRCGCDRPRRGSIRRGDQDRCCCMKCRHRTSSAPCRKHFDCSPPVDCRSTSTFGRMTMRSGAISTTVTAGATTSRSCRC